MALDQHTYELIDQYLRGELVGQDLDKFKIRLKDDADFLAQVQLQKAIIEAVEARRASELKTLLQKAGTKSKPYIVPIQTRYLAVAASLLSLLAFGLIIKTLLPQQQPEFVEKTSPIIEDDTTSNSIALVDSASEVENLEQDSDPVTPVNPSEVADVIQGSDTAGLIAMADDVTEDDMVEATMSDSDEAEVVRFDELKKAEDLITLKSGVEPQHDSMIGVGYISAYTVTVKEMVETDDNDKLSKRERRKAKEEASVQVAEPTKTKTSDVKIEYWHSVLGSSKVKYDGNKLVVFEEPNQSSYTLIQYKGATYLKKNQNYYHLPISSSFAALRQVTDSSVLEAIKQ